MSLPNEQRKSSLWGDAWRRLAKNKLAVIGAILLAVLTFASLCGPMVLSQSYYAQNLQLGATPPSTQHWLGTDTLGRDLLARILYGGRISLAVGLFATGVALTIGVLYGTISGFLGGKVDAVMMRIVDIIFALPFTVFVILLMVLFGREFMLLFVAIGAVQWLTMARIVRGQVMSLREMEFIEAAEALGLSKARIIFRHMIPNAIGAVQWLTMARIVRGQVMSLREMEFIEAAEALGLSKARIIFRHMIPNAIGPIIVYATLTVPSVMLLEAFLSFLGLGVQPPMSSWGVLIKEGAETMEEFPWLLIYPGLALALTLFSLNFLGDGLRDALDPQAAKD
jgi:oligopeptide transport system permease protein